jgi:hypothetical protein
VVSAGLVVSISAPALIMTFVIARPLMLPAVRSAPL